MKSILRYFDLATVQAMFLLLVAPLHAAAAVPAPTPAPTVEATWWGTWKLNRELSHLVGSSITIGRSAHGYHFDFGAVSFDVGDDGKDYPTLPTRTTSIQAIGPRLWRRVHKVHGKEVDHGTLTLTPDQRTMLIHTVATDTAGGSHVSDETETRVGTGSGLAGTWRSTLIGANVSRTIVLGDAGAGRIRWAFPDDGQFYVIRPGGKPAVYGGTRAVPGVTVVLQRVSGSHMRWTESINGKAYVEGIDTLSADGMRLTEITWPVARVQDRQEAVYERSPGRVDRSEERARSEPSFGNGKTAARCVMGRCADRTRAGA